MQPAPEAGRKSPTKVQALFAHLFFKLHVQGYGFLDVLVCVGCVKIR